MANMTQTVEIALSGVGYPASRDALARHARESAEEEIAEIVEDLPDRDHADAADVACAFGGSRAHQPSIRGGEAAMQSAKLSVARAASLFAGMDFPASAEDLKAHARSQASEAGMEVTSRLPDDRYGDMSDVEKAFGEVKNEDRG